MCFGYFATRFGRVEQFDVGRPTEGEADETAPARDAHLDRDRVVGIIDDRL